MHKYLFIQRGFFIPHSNRKGEKMEDNVVEFPPQETNTTEVKTPEKGVTTINQLRKKVKEIDIYSIPRDPDVDTGKGYGLSCFSKNKETGKKRMLMRQCTNDYKVQPITQKVRELIGLKKGEKRKKGTKVEMIMGISLDEVFRQKPNRLPYIENQWPLIEKKLRREDCVKWMESYGYGKPPRSACTFCPFHNDKEWQQIKENKAEWDEVVRMDRAIRDQERHKNTDNEYTADELFLHRSCQPIDEVDFDKSTNQLDFFNEECEGMCGN